MIWQVAIRWVPASEHRKDGAEWLSEEGAVCCGELSVEVLACSRELLCWHAAEGIHYSSDGVTDLHILTEIDTSSFIPLLYQLDLSKVPSLGTTVHGTDQLQHMRHGWSSEEVPGKRKHNRLSSWESGIQRWLSIVGKQTHSVFPRWLRVILEGSTRHGHQFWYTFGTHPRLYTLWTISLSEAACL